MTQGSDFRIQLRKNIHELVVAAAARRCVTPAALVSMVVYDYLRTCGELVCSEKVPSNLNEKPAATPRARATPVADYDALARDWTDEDDDD